jgi:hypothetical protein
MNKVNWGRLEDSRQFSTGLVLGCLKDFEKSSLVPVCEPDLGTVREDGHKESLEELPPLDEGEPPSGVAEDP